MTFSRKARRLFEQNLTVNATVCEICGLHNIIVPGAVAILCIHKGGTNYTTDINWAYQNKLNAEWLAANPNAQYQGWMSI